MAGVDHCQEVLEDFEADSNFNWFIGSGSWSPTQQSTGSPGAKKPSKTSTAEVARSSTGKEGFEKEQSADMNIEDEQVQGVSN